MTRPTKLIVNCTTGEQSEVELTDDEISQLEIDRVNAENRQKERERAEAEKSRNRISAISKLTALGLTEDEVTALL